MSDFIQLINGVAFTFPSGGGTVGTVGGSDSQVQYNSAGASAGTANLTIDSDQFPVFGEGQGAAPAVPAAGTKVFSRLRAGRNMLCQVTPIGSDYSYQPCIFAQKIGYFAPVGNGTTIHLVGINNSATGTATARNVASTNLLQSLRRIGYVSTATAGSSAGTRHNAQQFWRGNADGLGGFFFVARFGLSSATTVARQRSFVGLLGSTAALGNANPSSNTTIPMLGFGVDSGDSSWTFMHGNGTTVVKDTLTGTFPPNGNTSAFEARIYCPPNGNTIFYSLEVLGGGSLFEGSTTTTIPSNTVFLSPQLWTNNGTTALACAIDVVSIYIETDN